MSLKKYSPFVFFIRKLYVKLAFVGVKVKKVLICVSENSLRQT